MPFRDDTQDDRGKHPRQTTATNGARGRAGAVRSGSRRCGYVVARSQYNSPRATGPRARRKARARGHALVDDTI
eukprot:2322415-Lingulodinium_polyedra.AAC.1